MVHTNIPSMVLMYQDEYRQGTTMKAWEKLTNRFGIISNDSPHIIMFS
jgi:hypothetical protein